MIQSLQDSRETEAKCSYRPCPSAAIYFVATAKKKQIQGTTKRSGNQAHSPAVSAQTALEFAHEKLMRNQTGTPGYEKSKEELLDALFSHAR